MKKNVLLAFAVCGLLFSCKKEEKAKIEDAKEVKEVVANYTYNVTPESKVYWNAHKIVGGHSGTFNVEEGQLNFENNVLKGGKVVFLVKTLKVTDVPETDESYGKLVGHLLAPDFFDMEKFPKAIFEITSVEGSKITGNLTLKEVTKSVSFDANINKVDDNSVQLYSNKFSIDRTEWGIEYNSGKFADPAKLGDYLIKDDVDIKIDIKATK